MSALNDSALFIDTLTDSSDQQKNSKKRMKRDDFKCLTKVILFSFFKKNKK